MTTNLPERFWAKVQVTPGCWNWIAYRMNGGRSYGVYNVGGRTCLAHRTAWIDVNGPVPDGMELDHLCRNRGCVNPDHLQAVDRGTNVRRGSVFKVDAMLVSMIRHEYGPPRGRWAAHAKPSTTDLSVRFGVSQARISQIVRGA